MATGAYRPRHVVSSMQVEDLAVVLSEVPSQKAEQKWAEPNEAALWSIFVPERAPQVSARVARGKRHHDESRKDNQLRGLQRQ